MNDFSDPTVAERLLTIVIIIGVYWHSAAPVDSVESVASWHRIGDLALPTAVVFDGYTSTCTG